MHGGPQPANPDCSVLVHGYFDAKPTPNNEQSRRRACDRDYRTVFVGLKVNIEICFGEIILTNIIQYHPVQSRISIEHYVRVKITFSSDSAAHCRNSRTTGRAIDQALQRRDKSHAQGL